MLLFGCFQILLCWSLIRRIDFISFALIFISFASIFVLLCCIHAVVSCQCSLVTLESVADGPVTFVSPLHFLSSSRWTLHCICHFNFLLPCWMSLFVDSLHPFSSCHLNVSLSSEDITFLYFVLPQCTQAWTALALAGTRWNSDKLCPPFPMQVTMMHRFFTIIVPASSPLTTNFLLLLWWCCKMATQAVPIAWHFKIPVACKVRSKLL